jgi:ABC-type multidrug transport system ATPase subunit
MERLVWDGVWARYERLWVLRGATLHVAAGAVACVVGPAGSGKTSLLRVAAGSLKPGYGHAWLDGAPLRLRSRGLLRPEERPMPSTTVSAAVMRRLARSGVHGRKAERRARLAIHAWDLEPFRDTPLRKLSETTLSRARLAISWACPASAWLLDNPSAGLDREWRERLPRMLTDWRDREGGCVVLTSADPEEARNADIAAVMSGGRIVVAAAPARLLQASGPEEIVVRTLDDAASARTLVAGLRIEAERTADGLRLRVRDAEAALPGVIQTLGAAVETVWVRRPTMSDAVAYHVRLPVPEDLPQRPPRCE